MTQEARIASLLDSIDDDAAPIDAGHHAAWTEAIDRRLQGIREGRVNLIDADVAVARARAAITKR